MEADWEFDVAADAPVIDAAWSGFIDLRRQPERASQLPETHNLPALADALLALNAAASGFLTAKCDVWNSGTIDPDEFDATTETATSALACYIDLLPVSEHTWPTLDAVADWCRTVCAGLRARPLRQCRADLVIRSAFLAPDRTGLGVTAYLAGCASSAAGAIHALEPALRAFADTIRAGSRPPQRAKSYNE